MRAGSSVIARMEPAISVSTPTTIEFTTFPNAPPMMTATARSTTVP